jgi:tRNA dimethylallyltransferase
MEQERKYVIVIAGPTAVGKTAAAIDIARHFDTEILSADSRQCYRELSIGVARPSPEELAAVPHHFIASHSIVEKVTAATYESYALETLNRLFTKKKVVVVTGGTGLYIKALLEGLDEIPEVPEAIHRQVLENYELGGLAWLRAELQAKDPAFWQSGEIHNPQRMLRALEVFLTSGQSILSYRRERKATRPFTAIQLALELPREELYHRINNRVECMMEQGLLNEAKLMQAFRGMNALQTVGYRELFRYLDGELTLEQAVHIIQQNTRQYAKRQITWFRHQGLYHWCKPYSNIITSILDERIKR